MARPTAMIATAFLAIALGCKTKNPDFCESNDDCAGSARSFCDVSGAIDGTANTCILPPNEPDAGTPEADAGAACGTPDSFLRCDGDTAITCSATGTEVGEACGFGCNDAAERCNECTPNATVCTEDTVTACTGDGLIDSATPCPLACHTEEVRCNQLVPSNGLAEYLDLAADADDVLLTDGAEIDTDSGAVTNGDAAAVLVPSFTLPAPADGVPIRVFVVRSLTGGDVTVRGAPAIAIVAHDEITIGGTFRLSRSFFTPGSAPSGAACAGGGASTSTIGSQNHASGAGGGGYRDTGGTGGSIEMAPGGAGGAGGAAFPNADLVPLRGGCHGGGTKGHAGGAVQLVSGARISVLNGGAIDANGGRGDRGEDPPGTGGGGGSGGGILLEAPEVLLEGSAVLAANGGGGGCATDDGEDGRMAASPAAAGVCSASTIGSGGTGGTGDVPPTAGESLPGSGTTSHFAGSGGGSAGYIRINTATGAFDLGSSTVVSPAATTAIVRSE